MKKFFVLAAMAAFALVSCDNGDIDLGKDEEGEKKVTPIVLNELDGEKKFIELYNNTDEALSLAGYQIVKYDSKKDGGKTVTWTGAEGMTIAAKGWVVLESSDLKDPAEKGDENYQYESENHVFNGGLTAKKNTKIELLNAAGEVADTFIRGEETSAGWNQTEIGKDPDKNSYSRCPDGVGEWAYAVSTKGAANSTKVKDIE